MHFSRLFFLLGTFFVGSSLALSFDDQSWRSEVTARGKDATLHHYAKSQLPLPEVDCFPQGFKWGVAIAEFQNSGAATLPHSNWAAFESKKKLEPSGKSVDHWHAYPQDIKLIKDLNLNSLRFSIDWSSIQPALGQWNEEAFKRYDALCDAMLSQGITLMATLHHFTHPAWFDELGGFEKEENIKYFVEFSEQVFRRFHGKINLWCTINEPGVYAMCGYFLGIHSPGKPVQAAVAGRVLKHLLKAHVAVYERLRMVINELQLGHEKHEIGIVHNVLKFTTRYTIDAVGKLTGSLFTGIAHDPVMHALATNEYRYNPLSTINTTTSVASLAALILSFLVQKKQDESIVDWAKKHWIIVGSSVAAFVASNIARAYCATSETIAGLSKSFDFIGLNYYARAVVGFNGNTFFGPTCFPDQVMGDMDLPVSDPAGYAEAIEAVATFGKPVYLTETGCADAHDDRRPLLMRESMQVVGQALKKGIDIRGYYHWTLMDNYEWHNGFKPKFGLCDRHRNPHLSAFWLKSFIAQVADASSVIV